MIGAEPTQTHEYGSEVQEGGLCRPLSTVCCRFGVPNRLPGGHRRVNQSELRGVIQRTTFRSGCRGSRQPGRNASQLGARHLNCRGARGSNRRRKRAARLAATRRKQAARRMGRANEFTTKVVRERFVIAIEATSVRDPTGRAKGTRAMPGKLVQEKAGVNRRTLNVAPCRTRRTLERKAARRGGTAIKFELQDTAMPCSACGSESDGPRKSRANFVCRDCGHVENVDLHAARNILFRALPGRVVAPREASREPGSVSQGARTAIESPSGPAIMAASENRDGRDGNPDTVLCRELQ